MKSEITTILQKRHRRLTVTGPCCRCRPQYRSKMQSITIALLLVLLLVSASCSQISQETPPPPFVTTSEPEKAENIRTIRPYSSKVKFEQISLEDGLSQSTVNDILQDSQGLLWIATLDGLNRYDGYNIHVYKHNPTDDGSLAHDFVTVLYEDSRGQLWVGTDGGGLDSYDHSTELFSHYRAAPDEQNSISSDHIRSIVEDVGGSLWIGTVNGLNRLNLETGEIRQYLVQDDSENIDPLAGYVSDLQVDEDGQLWVGTLSGLLTFESQNGDFEEHPLSQTDPAGNRVLSIYEDNQGFLWVGTLGGGLHMFDKSSGEVSSYPYDPEEPSSLGGSTAADIVQDQFGTLWIATENGLDRLTPDRQRFIHYTHDPNDLGSVSDSEIRSLFVDSSGVLWVGTSIGGLSKSDPYKVKFDHLPADRKDPRLLSSSEVWTIFEDSQGYLWVGTTNGLDRVNQRTGLVDRFRYDANDDTTIPHPYLTDIAEDPDGQIWISTLGGLAIFDDSSQSFRPFNGGMNDSTEPTIAQPTKIHFDDESSLWIGTAGSGFHEFNLDTESINSYSSLEEGDNSELRDENYILAIYEQEDSPYLWFGTMGGMVQFDRNEGQSTYFRHDPADPDSLAQNIVSAIHPDGQGGLWVATGYGLDHFDRETGLFTHYREEDGLTNNLVLGIEEDDLGQLWLSTNRGMSRFDPVSETFRNFDTHDGLQSLEFNGGAHFKSDSGRMFFGGVNGINMFHPDDIFDNSFVPPVVVTDFQIQNRSVPVGPDSPLKQSLRTTDHIELSGGDSVFSFEIASLHYGSPEENQYAYIMEGFDREWNYIGNRRFASYTNLPPGEYTFRAIATNNDGIWNLEGVTIDIVIPLPFWRQWWFVGLALLLLMAVAAIGYRSRTRSTARRTRELEEQVDARTSEIERRGQIAEGLREILVILNTSPSLEEGLNYIVTQAARLTDAEDTVIFRRLDNGPVVVVATNPGGQIRQALDPALIDLVDRWSAEKLAEKGPLIISNLPAYWESIGKDKAHAPDVHSALLGIPLIVTDDVYGGLLMFYNQTRDFDQDDLDLGFTFADQAALAIANNQLREQVKETAAASERSRLARELHDAVTQTLFSASLIAESLGPTWEQDPEAGLGLIQDLRQLTRGALAEMRTLLMELRPSALEEAHLPDLFNQLGESAMGRASVEVTVHVDSAEPIPANVRVALYRIAQESLNNIVKHSRARNAELALRYNPEEGYRLSVVDDGCGFDLANVPGHHLGLNIISERAQAIGAELTIESEIDRGTRVTVLWHPDNQEV